MPQQSTGEFRPRPIFFVSFRALLLLVFAAAASARADETSAPKFPSAESAALSLSTDAAAAIHDLPPAPDEKKAPTENSAPEISPVPSEKPAPKIAPPVPVPAPKPAPKTTAKPETLRDAARRLKLPLPLPRGRVVVLKAQRKLEIWNGDTLVKSYRVALGAVPTGHKARQGDNRTPEGEFFICTRNAQTSAFHIFLGLSYPALPDAQRGLKNRAISEREFRAIRSRLASRGAPLWRTRLGGWVGIHGGTNEKFARKQSQKRGTPDWTAGCIALTNKEIEEIAAATKLGTPVSVRP